MLAVSSSARWLERSRMPCVTLRLALTSSLPKATKLVATLEISAQWFWCLKSLTQLLQLRCSRPVELEADGK
tara:strand:+ start:131 stop:346 length:216 start_codon:yes stop_codon:yes gene_type:complete